MMLREAGYEPLCETGQWKNLNKGKYFLSRNDSSLIAFELNRPLYEGFRMVGAHTDSPCLKIKPNAITENNGYMKLGVEVYGGALLNPWFDRDLGVAGRVTVKPAAKTNRNGIENLLINFRKPVAFIPSLAIHLDREVNEQRSINKQKHLPAVLCRSGDNGVKFEALLKGWIKANHARKKIDHILAFELSLYDVQPASLVGLNEEFIASARLDNLLSCFGGVQGLIASKAETNKLLILNDHEEVGSASASGAQGPFLQSAIERLCGDVETMQRCILRSMMISADNAHGVHPNYAEKHEPDHQPLINAGPVIKINHNQRYATNSETEAVFRTVCTRAKVPVQMLVVRSDMGCGSTIGPIIATRLGVRTVDVGVPQLGMHSIRELAGVADQDHLRRVLTGFYDLPDWPF